MKNHDSFNDDYDIVWALLNIAFGSGSRGDRRQVPDSRQRVCDKFIGKLSD
ncbi:MAG: hypothetical protein LBS35_07960 [Synergistaceae bacterium]|nr:hypothetical protein [Synergistaceae bacterium]